MNKLVAFGAGLIGSSLRAVGLLKPFITYGFDLLRRALMFSYPVFEIAQNQITTPVLAAQKALDNALVQAECFA